MQTIDFKDFQRVDIRVGTVVNVETFPEARNPSFKLWVDLGKDLGVKKSSAQLTVHYDPADLLGKQVVCICNFEPRQIANFMSEILVTGFESEEGGVVITTVERPVPNGARLY